MIDDDNHYKKSITYNGGGGEIRTLEWFPIAGFQDRCLQPLGHSSISTSNN